MNPKMIGKFIAQQRKIKKLTQFELAEKLEISDRAVSKWERGINLPDASLMIELSNILDITVNELLSGKKIEKSSYEKEAEENLIELQKLNEINIKRLFLIEWVIVGIVTISSLIIIFISLYAIQNSFLQTILFVCTAVIFFIGIYFAMIIEQKVGYYECTKCHNLYIPTFNQICFSMHLGKTRYIKCPKCNKCSWSKKVMIK